MEFQEEVNKISEKLEYATPEQIFFILGVLNMPIMPNKQDLMNLSLVTEQGKIDTATPQPYIERIKEIHPNVADGNLVFDYRKNSMGELKNINDFVIERLLNLQR